MQYDTITVFAPATIANLGPGYDVLGVAIEGLGDWVTVSPRDDAEVVIESIEGDGGRLSRDPAKNTAGIAAKEVLRLMESPRGVTLRLRKGLPLGSGLGSSGASAAAGAWAVNVLFGQPLGKTELLKAGLIAEASVSGWHADNVGPSLFGGFILIREYHPLDMMELPAPHDIVFVLCTPDVEMPTRAARAAVPTMIPIDQHIANNGNLAAMVAALFGGSVPLLGRAMHDVIVEPARAHLIPAFYEVKEAAMKAGALACSISGGGPTLFALSDDPAQAAVIGRAMQETFMQKANLASSTHVSRVDAAGARIVAL